MHYKVLKDIIDLDKITKILDFFNSNNHLHENKMFMQKIINPWKYDVVNTLNEDISNYIDTSTNIGDNIYKHYYPYYPHVDIDDSYPSVNFLIPLFVEDNKTQHFVIFDQYVKNNKPKTWLGNTEITGEFVKNLKEKFIHNDPDVENCTNNPIDEMFYTDYLEQEGRSKDLFFGCSGNAVEFKPGDAIIFDSKFIHCTGKMNAEYKIGLSLRFKGNINW
jgi:hypothetical protein